MINIIIVIWSVGSLVTIAMLGRTNRYRRSEPVVTWMIAIICGATVWWILLPLYEFSQWIKEDDDVRDDD